MTKVDKLIKNIFAGKAISYSQAESVLLQLDFDLREGHTTYSAKRDISRMFH